MYILHSIYFNRERESDYFNPHDIDLCSNLIHRCFKLNIFINTNYMAYCILNNNKKRDFVFILIK